MQLQFECDEGLGSRAALGLIVLQADETIEKEFRPLFDLNDVVLYHARIPSGPEVNGETLMRMKASLTDTAALLPGNRPLDVIGYACTSASTVIGSEAVETAIRKAHPTARVTNPATAVITALKHLGVTRVGVVTPYIAEISEAVVDLLRNAGLDPLKVGSFGQSEEATVARISPQSVEQAVQAIGEDTGVEAVFASCTNLRTFPVIEACEKRLGKPVISSNLALAWHMMTLAGLKTAGSGPGKLFES
ncbi:aspartate/glutamate racemase family protein [Roseibium sp. MMSF_3412]|uniref:maleate cis-trans isomerase family protein n=1 Tax=Roseibium sp. MMSF_3412 TaxID=3046712 RepID=UPI0027401E8D|nr:aspartate/glutamate racemase family protein [Roseibium sp. MMSF_3412]